MSIQPEAIGIIPEETIEVAKATLPLGNAYLDLRDEFGVIYQDEDFLELYPKRGRPSLAPWRLALVTIMQFRENLTDRQAANAVRAGIDLKYLLGLELKDPGFHYSVLSEFRARLVAAGKTQLLLDKMLEQFKTQGLLKAKDKQRSDSTHVLAASRVLNRLELVTETLRATLNELAKHGPEWLRELAPEVWFKRYTVVRNYCHRQLSLK